MPTDNPSPTDSLPEAFVSEARALTQDQLGAAIQFLKTRRRPSVMTPLDKLDTDDEDVVRITEEAGYTAVVKYERSGKNRAERHGPYLYHVTVEPRPDGNESLHWAFVGPVTE